LYILWWTSQKTGGRNVSTKAKSEVLALHVCIANGGVPLIGVQCPAKALADGALNLSVLQGGINPSEDPTDALAREFLEEYGILPSETVFLFETDHTSSHGKHRILRVHVFLVITGPKIQPNQKEVASFGWCCGGIALLSALDHMSPGKQAIVLRALRIAHGLRPDLAFKIHFPQLVK